MRHVQTIICVLLLLFASSVATRAQDIPPQMAQVIGELECKLQKSLPDWKRERVEPFSKTERVLIYVWSNCGRRVKVSINYSTSEAEAIRGLRRPTATEGKPVPGLGDEAFAWGYSDHIGMRKGNLTFSISAGSSLSLPGADAGESSALKRAEEVALNKGFARLISTFLSEPAVKCEEPFGRFR